MSSRWEGNPGFWSREREVTEAAFPRPLPSLPSTVMHSYGVSPTPPPMPEPRPRDGRLVVVANRLPVSRAVEEGSEEWKTSPGGLVSALAPFGCAVESFLDAGDAVKRRKRADRIYRDLVAERISQARAAAELQALNKRQKGGWLLARIRRISTGLGLSKS